MFKVAFNKDLVEEDIIKEFNGELPRNYFELQICFSSVKRNISKGFTNLYLGMTLLDGVEDFIAKFNKEFKHINVGVLAKNDNDYLIKMAVAKSYNIRTRGLVIYVTCCMIRLFYEDNFGKLGCKNNKVLGSLEEDMFKFIIERNKECKIMDRLHCLYGYEDIDLLTKEVILAFDNFKIMNATAKRVSQAIYNIESQYAQNNIIYNTIQCLQLDKEIIE